MQKKTEDMKWKFEARVVDELHKRKLIPSPNISYESLKNDSHISNDLRKIDNEFIDSMLTKYTHEIKEFNKMYFKQKEDQLRKMKETENVDINDLIRKIHQNYISN